MARITPVEIDKADGEAKVIFEDFMRERGNIPNMFRTLAHRPEILKTAFDHFRTVLNTGTLELRLKELVAVRVSQINDCAY